MTTISRILREHVNKVAPLALRKQIREPRAEKRKQTNTNDVLYAMVCVIIFAYHCMNIIHNEIHPGPLQIIRNETAMPTYTVVYSANELIHNHHPHFSVISSTFESDVGADVRRLDGNLVVFENANTDVTVILGKHYGFMLMFTSAAIRTAFTPLLIVPFVGEVASLVACSFECFVGSLIISELPFDTIIWSCGNESRVFHM